MNKRRSFIKTGITLASAFATGALPHIVSGQTASAEATGNTPKLRVLFASDGHYGEPGTPYHETHADIIKWIKQEHQQQKIDFVIFNGDIVHDRPELLKEVRDKYFSQLPMAYYVLPGNHDHATPAIWKELFGYSVNFTIERNNIGFVLANTSNEKGEYVCPDIDFLEEAFKHHQANDLVFVVLHIPPHKWLPEETYFTECQQVIDLLHRYKNIKAVFHGHDHSLDSVRYTNKLPHFFDGHYGGSWGTTYRGFRILEIGADNSMITFQKNPVPEPVLNKQQIR